MCARNEYEVRFRIDLERTDGIDYGNTVETGRGGIDDKGNRHPVRPTPMVSISIGKRMLVDANVILVSNGKSRFGRFKTPIVISPDLVEAPGSIGDLDEGFRAVSVHVIVIQIAE